MRMKEVQAHRTVNEEQKASGARVGSLDFGVRETAVSKNQTKR